MGSLRAVEHYHLALIMAVILFTESRNLIMCTYLGIRASLKAANDQSVTVVCVLIREGFWNTATLVLLALAEREGCRIELPAAVHDRNTPGPVRLLFR